MEHIAESTELAYKLKSLKLAVAKQLKKRQKTHMIQIWYFADLLSKRTNKKYQPASLQR